MYVISEVLAWSCGVPLSKLTYYVVITASSYHGEIWIWETKQKINKRIQAWFDRELTQRSNYPVSDIGKESPDIIPALERHKNVWLHSTELREEADTQPASELPKNLAKDISLSPTFKLWSKQHTTHCPPFFYWDSWESSHPCMEQTQIYLAL